jgi:hypothetical protein
VTSALIQSAVPKELSTTQHNLLSVEIRQLRTRQGLDRNIAIDVKTPSIFDGSIHERMYGLEVSALAEGTRVWATELFPFAIGPAGDLSFTPDFPMFPPPSFDPPGDLCCYGVDVPEISIDWPGVPPWIDEPTSDPPPYGPGPEDPPDAPYGPEDPPGWGEPPTTCPGWVVEDIFREFGVAVQITQWYIYVRKDDGPFQAAEVCRKNYCSPGTLNCANYADTAAPALAQAIKVVMHEADGVTPRGESFEVVPGQISATCSSLNLTLTSDETETIDLEHVAAQCTPAIEFPTGNVIGLFAVEYVNSFNKYEMLVDVTVLGYKALVLASKMCRQPDIVLRWENGYTKSVPLAAADEVGSTEIDGDDLKIVKLNIGSLDELKTNTNYPSQGPCAIEPLNASVRCRIPALIWDCDGVPPPRPQFETLP